MAELRTVEERKAAVLGVLEGQRDLWLATADAAGRPHLIAVSAWWDGTDLVVATTAGSRTASNLAASPRARLAAGAPNDVVMIDARVVESLAANQAAEVADGFAIAVGWDPREVGEDWVFYRLRPTRIQAYRGYDELEGRDVMRRSAWLA
ncbi:MAG TPA: pyridoxamine 5'-phosphate oxidase family protein [Verrucomicrobiae bacterium]|nr:pyridoxamine 5'-phosphate oxidase family protein [Verrucomicrobiae bacterium]